MPLPSISGIVPVAAAGAAIGMVSASALGGFASLLARAVSGANRDAAAGPTASGGESSSATDAALQDLNPLAGTQTSRTDSSLGELLEAVRLGMRRHLAAFGAESPSRLAVRLGPDETIHVDAGGSGRSHVESLVPLMPGLADLLKAIGGNHGTSAPPTVVVTPDSAWIAG